MKIKWLAFGAFYPISCSFFLSIVIVDLIVFVGSIITSALVEKSNHWLKKNHLVFFLLWHYVLFCNSATWCNCGVVKLYIFTRARDILYVRLHLCSNRAMGFGFLYITLFENYFGVFHWASNTNGFQTHSLNNWNRYYTGANRELTIFKILLILSSVTNE